MTEGRSEERRVVHKKTLIAILIALVVIVGIAAWQWPRQAGPRIPESVQRVLDAQRGLPAEEVQALQDLRLVAGVQAVYFNQNGSYTSPEELQGGGFLDPEWPRASGEAYRVGCTVLQDRVAFECYADPVSPEFTNHYFVDPSQIVRMEKNRRPDGNSPAFGMTKESR